MTRSGARPMLRWNARCALGLASGWMAIACGAPHYVSLGGNDSAVHAEASASDAGSELFDGRAPGDFARANERDLTQPCSFGAARLELRGTCDGQPFAVCPDLGEAPALTLDAVLSSVLRECGELENRLSVSFEQGCPVAFELASDAATPDIAASAAPLSPTPSPDAGVLETDALDVALPERASRRRCVAERLTAQRLECARDIACGHGINFAVPTL